MKDINLEIKKLLELKEELDKITELKKTNENLIIVSQARYDFLNSKHPIEPNKYYIASLELRPYIEGYQG